MARKHRVARFGGFQCAAAQWGQHSVRHGNAVTLQDGECIGAGAGVSHRGATRDNRGVIPWHVADGEGHHLGGSTRSGHAPALDGREVFAHRVHLADVGTTLQQLAVDLLLLFQRQAFTRQGQQGRAAPRDEAQHQVVGREPLRQLQDTLRSRQACRVGHGVGSLDHFDTRGQTFGPGWCVVVTRHHQARQRGVGGPQRLHRLCHGTTRLASAQHQRAAFGRRWQKSGRVVQWQGTLHRHTIEVLQQRAGIVQTGHSRGRQGGVGHTHECREIAPLF